MASKKSTSRPAPGDPNYGKDPNAPHDIFADLAQSNNDPSRPPWTKDQIDVLRQFSQNLNLSHDDQVKLLNAMVDRASDRWSGGHADISPQEILDFAKETSYTPEEKSAVILGQPVKARPNGQGTAPPTTAAPQTPGPVDTTPAPHSPYGGFFGAVQKANVQLQPSEADWAEVATTLGYGSGQDAKNSYDSALARYQANAKNLQAKGETPPQFAKPIVWVQQQRQALEGQWSTVVDQIGDSYTANHGVAMPAELRTQLVNHLNSLPPSAQANLTSAMATAQPTPDSSGNIPPQTQAQQDASHFINGYMKTLGTQIVEPYAGLHQTTSDLQSTADSAAGNLTSDRVQQYIAAFGNKPLPPDAKNWNTMSADAWKDYLGKQPYKLGMTKTAYDVAASQISGKWQDAFGVPASDATIAWAAGKSGDEVTAFINGQPSRVKGMNVGQYNGVVKSGDSISQQLWGHPLDDHLVGLLWGHLNGGNPPPSTPPPALGGTPQNIDYSTLPSTTNSGHTKDTGLGSTLPSAT